MTVKSFCGKNSFQTKAQTTEVTIATFGRRPLDVLATLLSSYYIQNNIRYFGALPSMHKSQW